MSYSSCFACGKMVFSYEKYCRNCEKIYQQNAAYWKNPTYSEGDEKKAELARDLQNKANSLQYFEEVTEFTKDHYSELSRNAFVKSGRKSSRRRR